MGIGAFYENSDGTPFVVGRRKIVIKTILKKIEKISLNYKVELQNFESLHLP